MSQERFREVVVRARPWGCLCVLLLAGPVHATPQTLPQRQCIKAMLKSASLTLDAQGSDSRRCLREAARGRLQRSGSTALQCVTDDALRSVGDRKRQAATREARKCLRQPLQHPDFGKTDAERVGAAVVGAQVGLLADLLGPDLDRGVSDCRSDSAGCRCQERVLQTTEPLMLALLNEFRQCVRAGLRRGVIVDAAGMEACVGSDGRARLAARRADLATAVAGVCLRLGAEQSRTFPGQCGQANNLTACVSERVACRICRMINEVAALATDCDQRDDGQRNASCP